MVAGAEDAESVYILNVIAFFYSMRLLYLGSVGEALEPAGASAGRPTLIAALFVFGRTKRAKFKQRSPP